MMMIPCNACKLLYVYSCDLDVNVQVKIGSLEGKLEKPSYELLEQDASLQRCVAVRRQGDGVHQPPQDLFVTATVHSNGLPLALPVSTSYKCFRTRWSWNEWLTLPVKYSELSRDTQLAISVYDIHDTTEPHCIGGTTVSLFSKRGLFRSGIIDLKIWPFKEADGCCHSTTPGKLKSSAKYPPTTADVEVTSDGEADGDKFADESRELEMRRLSKLTKKHRSGLIDKVDWLDRLTFREIELINEREKRRTRSLYLMVEFPRVHYDDDDFVVVYYERNGDEVKQLNCRPTLVTMPDPEMGLENLVEAKHMILTRSARSGTVDRELKPNAITRDKLEQAVQAAPSKELTVEDRDALWKFRFYLSTNKKALTKFLRSVNWSQDRESKQAVELMKEWAPIDPEDALELLSPYFTNPAVRKYAVSRVTQTNPEDLHLYLLFLVQALKYENLDAIKSGTDSSFVQDITLSGSTATHEAPSNSADDGRKQDLLSAVVTDLLESQTAGVVGTTEQSQELSETGSTTDQCSSSLTDSSDFLSDLPDLASFLIKSACKDACLANYFYWYLKVEVDSYQSREASTSAATASSPNYARDLQIRRMYATVLRRLTRALCRGGVEAKRRAALLVKQQLFVNHVVDLMKAVAKESGNRKKKIEFLQTKLALSHNVEGPKAGPSVDLANLEGLPLPVDPTVKVQSVLADRASLFNSALQPAKLTFRTVDNRHYVTIFKRGDDLRQDQLVMQVIRLMDKLLRAENLDLRLTPYHVLATSTQDGFVQFVDSVPLRNVIEEWNSVQDFFRYYRPSATGPYGIEPDVIDNYVRSCAGYSVICYLLGVGDRHQHNLLLCKNGRLFHVDFGFILGRDPKPLPPPMKLTGDMINGMGGVSSKHWAEFRRLCYTAFLHLRRHANVVLNLFSLMLDAGIPDIALEPDRAVKKVEDRFQLDLTDEEAVQHIQLLIDTSVSAKMPILVDWVHDWKVLVTN